MRPTVILMTEHRVIEQVLACLEALANRAAETGRLDGDSARQLIELDFEEIDGMTTVRFTHSGLWDEESVRSHEDGWGRCFDNLERTLEAAGRRR